MANICTFVIEKQLSLLQQYSERDSNIEYNSDYADHVLIK